MTDTSPGDDRYLWDRSAPVDPAVAEIEDSLRGLAFDPRTRPLPLPRRRPMLRRVVIPIGIAASVLLIAAVIFLRWRLTWETGRAWSVTRIVAGDMTRSTSADLPVGGRVQTSRSEEAILRIARLGAMTVASNTDVGLASTGPLRHRIDMTRGTIDVRVWAPPGRFAVRTPAGEVIDLGCIFRLVVDGNGTSNVAVKTGWVEIANNYGESLIPAGASSQMTASDEPLVPVYDDASPEFKSAVRAFEHATRLSNGAGYASEAASLGRQARVKDVFTLMMLAVRNHGEARAPLVEAAARLAPPPARISLPAVVAGDNDLLWAWKDTLPLPPPKSWWRNWPDILPRSR